MTAHFVLAPWRMRRSLMTPEEQIFVGCPMSVIEKVTFLWVVCIGLATTALLIPLVVFPRFVP